MVRERGIAPARKDTLSQMFVSLENTQGDEHLQKIDNIVDYALYQSQDAATLFGSIVKSIDLKTSKRGGGRLKQSGDMLLTRFEEYLSQPETRTKFLFDLSDPDSFKQFHSLLVSSKEKFGENVLEGQFTQIRYFRANLVIAASEYVKQKTRSGLEKYFLHYPLTVNSGELVGVENDAFDCQLHIMQFYEKAIASGDPIYHSQLRNFFINKLLSFHKRYPNHESDFFTRKHGGVSLEILYKNSQSDFNRLAMDYLQNVPRGDVFWEVLSGGIFFSVRDQLPHQLNYNGADDTRNFSESIDSFQYYLYEKIISPSLSNEEHDPEFDEEFIVFFKKLGKIGQVSVGSTLGILGEGFFKLRNLIGDVDDPEKLIGDNTFMQRIYQESLLYPKKFQDGVRTELILRKHVDESGRVAASIKQRFRGGVSDVHFIDILIKSVRDAEGELLKSDALIRMVNGIKKVDISLGNERHLRVVPTWLRALDGGKPSELAYEKNGMEGLFSKLELFWGFDDSMTFHIKTSQDSVSLIGSIDKSGETTIVSASTSLQRQYPALKKVVEQFLSQEISSWRQVNEEQISNNNGDSKDITSNIQNMYETLNEIEDAASFFYKENGTLTYRALTSDPALAYAIRRKYPHGLAGLCSRLGISKNSERFAPGEADMLLLDLLEVEE
jgi:hypothetical protein